MVRDPDEGDAFVFDLVDDEGHLPPASPGPAAARDGDDDTGADGAEADEPPLRGVLGARLRTFTSVAAVLAVVLGTGFAVDGVRDAARIERVSQAPGGVVDVSTPLEELWTWEGQIGSDDSWQAFAIADLRGALAFRSEEELIGLDPATGEREWSVPLGENPDCGPVGYPGTGRLATSVLVCLQGVGTDREAITVGPGGVASEPRKLDAADDRRYGAPHPGPDGTVLRARRTGPESVIDEGDARCRATTGECSGTVEAGRDLVLRAEDGVTGEERWSVTIPFRATAAHECTPWFGIPWNGWDDPLVEDALAPEVFGAQIGAELVDLWGCGVRAAVTPDGVLLREGRPHGPTTVVALGDGRYAGQVTTQGAVGSVYAAFFAPDGEIVSEVEGYLRSPQAIDGPDGMTLLGSGQAGDRLWSYSTDGTVRWDVAVVDGPAEYLAQVAGTAVTATWTGSVRGFDLTTGAELWTWEPGEAGDASLGNEHVSQAFTDGRFVLLVLQGETGNVELASLDAASGELAWDRTTMADVDLSPEALLASVGGHLVAVTTTGITGLG